MYMYKYVIYTILDKNLYIFLENRYYTRKKYQYISLDYLCNKKYNLVHKPIKKKHKRLEFFSQII